MLDGTLGTVEVGGLGITGFEVVVGCGAVSLGSGRVSVGLGAVSVGSGSVGSETVGSTVGSTVSVGSAGSVGSGAGSSVELGDRVMPYRWAQVSGSRP